MTDSAQRDWRRILAQTERFAREQIDHRRWRRARHGVLPGGYDANAIAAQAITDRLTDWQHGALPDPEQSDPADLRRDLERRVRRLLDRLRHRKENALLLNEGDLSAVSTDDGEIISPLEAIPAPDHTPSEELEESTRLNESRHQFFLFLGNEPRLKRLFDCLSAGIHDSSTLAAKLKLAPRTIKTLRQRLNRRSARFALLRASGNIVAENPKIIG